MHWFRTLKDVHNLQPGWSTYFHPADNQITSATLPKGDFVFGQLQFDRRTHGGLRWDQTDTILDPALRRSGLTPYVSYYFNEFFRFRLSYEHRRSDLVSENGRNSVYMELNFVFGSSPSRAFLGEQVGHGAYRTLVRGEAPTPPEVVLPIGEASP